MKNEKITKLKERHSHDISELKSEVSVLNKASRELKRKSIANQTLAISRMEKLRNLRSMVNELKLEQSEQMPKNS